MVAEKKMASFVQMSVTGRCIEMMKNEYLMLCDGDLFGQRGGT